MPLLTVRLSDEDYAALKSLAGETSMAGLIRTWIAGTMPEVPMAVWVTRDRAEAAEARVRELEDEIKRLKRELALRPGSRYAEGGPGKWDKKAKGAPAIAGEDGPEIAAPPARFGAPRPVPKPGKKR